MHVCIHHVFMRNCSTLSQGAVPHPQFHCFFPTRNSIDVVHLPCSLSSCTDCIHTCDSATSWGWSIIDGPSLSLAASSCGLNGFYWKEHIDVFDRQSYITNGMFAFSCTMDKETCGDPKVSFPTAASLMIAALHTSRNIRDTWNIMFNFIAVWWDQILQALFFQKCATHCAHYCLLLENRENSHLSNIQTTLSQDVTNGFTYIMNCDFDHPWYETLVYNGI